MAGWPTTDGSGPIDSTPSVVASPGGLSSVLVGSGNDADPTTGGYQAYGPSGALEWFTPVVNPPTDAAPATGVQAGLAVGTLQGGGPDAVAGPLGQVSYALDAGTGAALAGWPFFNSDSTHSTAALADLYGTGHDEIVVGGDQTAGDGRGQDYTDGGHLRILNAEGDLICSPTRIRWWTRPRRWVASSLAARRASWSAPARTTPVPASPTPSWPTTGSASSNGRPRSTAAPSPPRLSPTSWATARSRWSRGRTRGPGGSGSVWVLDAATGQKIWEDVDIGRVIGSIVTADLSGLGYDDVIVPTTDGAFVLDGRTGNEITELSPDLGLQNAPLVTDDPNGTIGITLAGYEATGQSPDGVGRIDHYEINGSSGALAVGAGSWPMFHHDPQLTGDAGATTDSGAVPACSVPSAAFTGYRLAAADGGVFAFGDAPFCGSTGGIRLAAPVVGMASAPVTGGYWEVAADGGIFSFGGAGFYGSMGGKHLDQPIVGMAATPDGRGYWEVAADGGVFAFGDEDSTVRWAGSISTNRWWGCPRPPTATATAWWPTTAASSPSATPPSPVPWVASVSNAPAVGMVNDTNTGGYWEVASDGGVFSFGGAPFFGSTGDVTLRAPIVGMQETAEAAAATGWWPPTAASSASPPRSLAPPAQRSSLSRWWP